MFYENQPKEHQNNYKKMLSIIGSLSNIFSASNVPMLHYRAHENIFCKYFEAENLSREDCSADATKDFIGIGLKTWVGGDDQKVAEFGRLKPNYENLEGMELIKTIAEYRNERIRVTMNIHGLSEMIYHVVKRVPSAMKIYESAFRMIEIDKIKIDKSRGQANNTYFSDGHHTYHFSTSKNTLYMLFDDMELLDSFNVDILDDPYEILKKLIPQKEGIPYKDTPEEIEQYSLFDSTYKNQLCLRLYTMKAGKKVVEEKSGLNQWNGARKDKNGIYHPRNVDELYIPYPATDRKRKDFFPPRNTSFDLLLPDKQWISAKVCQSDGKAIMSNPNSALGHWLLRDVFGLKTGTLVTYDMLKVYGIDSVIFTKIEERKYSIDFCELGTYERFYGLEDSDDSYDKTDVE